MTTPLLELEGTWEEVSKRAAEFEGRRLRVIVLPPEQESDEEEIDSKSNFRQQRLTARELMKLSPEERSRRLEGLAARAESIYSNDPDLTDFEAFGDDDLFDETP